MNTNPVHMPIIIANTVPSGNEEVGGNKVLSIDHLNSPSNSRAKSYGCCLLVVHTSTTTPCVYISPEGGNDGPH